MNVGRNISHYRKIRGFTQKELGEKLGVSDVSISLWENGENEPRMGRIQQIADVLGVKTDEIIFGETYPRVIDDRSEFEKRRYEHITKKVKPLQEETNDQLLVREKEIPYKSTISVYGKIAAGQPIEAIEEIIDEINCPYPKLNKFNLIALQVNGDSMNKIIQNGDYAIIKRQEEVESGEIAAVLLDRQDATLKKFYKLPDRVILYPVSTNDSHQPIEITEDNNVDIQIIGKFMCGVTPLQD